MSHQIKSLAAVTRVAKSAAISENVIRRHVMHQIVTTVARRIEREQHNFVWFVAFACVNFLLLNAALHA